MSTRTYNLGITELTLHAKAQAVSTDYWVLQATGATEDYNVAHFTDYKHAGTEPGMPGSYVFTFSDNLAAGFYRIFIYTLDEVVIAKEIAYWDGTNWWSLNELAAAAQTAAEAVETLVEAGGDGDLAALKTTVDANLDAKVSEAGGLTEEEAEQLDEVATNVSLAKALAEAVKTQTDKLTFTENDVRATLDSEEVTPTSASKTNYALTAEERNSIADALLDRANAVDSKTVRQAMQIIAAVIAGKVSGAGTGTESFTGLDGDTPRVRVTATATGNRSAVEYYPE